MVKKLLRLFLLFFLIMPKTLYAQNTMRAEDLILPPSTGFETSLPKFNEETFDPELQKPAAIVNGEIITRHQVNDDPKQVQGMIEETLINQAVRGTISVYDPEYLDVFRMSLRRFVADLYYRKMADQKFSSPETESKYREFLEHFKVHEGLDYPVELIMRYNKLEAAALIRWVKAGNDFTYTQKQYSQLPDLLTGTPIRGYIEADVEKVRQELQKTLNAGEITPRPIEGRYGWFIGFKMPFEDHVEAQMAASREKFYARETDIIRKEFLKEEKDDLGLVRKPLPPYLMQGRLPPDEKMLDEPIASIKGLEHLFYITPRDLLHEYRRNALAQLDIPPSLIFQQIYSRQTSDLIGHYYGRTEFPETHPAVQSFIKEASLTLRRRIFFDRYVQSLEDVQQKIPQRYINLRQTKFRPTKIWQLQEISSIRLADITKAQSAWLKSGKIEDINIEGIRKRDMTDFYESDGVIITEESGEPVFVNESDYERYGAALLGLKPNQVSLSPHFNVGLWYIFKRIREITNFMPDYDLMKPALVRSLHVDIRDRLVEELRQTAKIEIQPGYDVLSVDPGGLGRTSQ